MFRGIFKLNSQEFTVYYDTMDNQDRLDICILGAEFQRHFNQVIYSRIVTTKEYVYGDESIYQSYNNIINTVESKIMNVKPDIYVNDNGKMVQEIRIKNSEFEYVKKKVNFEVKELYYKFGQDEIDLKFYMAKSKASFFSPFIEFYFNNTLKSEIVEKDVTYIPAEQLLQIYPLQYLKDMDMRYLDNKDEAYKYLKYLSTLPKEQICILDFETTTLDMYYDNPDAIITGLVIGTTTTSSVYLPFNQDKTNNLPIEMLQEAFERTKHMRTGAYNKSFEKKCLMKYGLDYTIKIDPMITAQIATGMPLGMQYGLKSQYQSITGNYTLELKDVFIKTKNIKFNILDKDTILLYAGPDGFSPIVVQQHYEKMLTEKQKVLLEEIEYPLTDEKARQEFYGIKSENKGLVARKEQVTKDANLLKNFFKELVKEDINMNSSQQIQSVIYDKLGAPVKVLTKNGDRSTGKVALKAISKLKRANPVDGLLNVKSSTGDTLIDGKALGAAAYPQVLVLQEYKKIEKELSSYYDVFLDNKSKTYHPWIKQNGTRTGRQSSNLQQMPKEMSKFFTPINEDYTFLDADWSQVELRIIYFLAGQKDMYEMCQNPLIDLHRVTASFISGVPQYLITPEMRKLYKAVNFSLVYDTSAKGMAESIYGLEPTQEQIRHCQGIIAQFYVRMKRIWQMKLDIEKTLAEQGFSQTLFGRRRAFPDYNNPDLSKSAKNAIKRQAKNQPVQGTAADYMKKSEILVGEEFTKRGWLTPSVETELGLWPKARIVQPIHDELLVEYHKSIPEWEIFKIMIDSMLHKLGGVMPLYPSMGIGESWKEAKSDGNSIPFEILNKIIDNKVSFEGTRRQRIDSLLEKKAELEKEHLDQYMQELFVKFDKDIDEIKKHVTDPVLSFVITDTFKNKDLEDDRQEHINYAVEQYYKTTDVEVSINNNKKEDEEEFKEMQTEIDINEYIDDLDVEDIEVVIEDSTDNPLDYVKEEQINRAKVYRNVFEYQNAIVIDLMDLPKIRKETLEKLDEVLSKYHVQDGLMSVKLLINFSKMLLTHYRIESAIEVSELIQNIIDEEKEVWRAKCVE